MLSEVVLASSYPILTMPLRYDHFGVTFCCGHIDQDTTLLSRTVASLPGAWMGSGRGAYLYSIYLCISIRGISVWHQIGGAGQG
jgi:hypothetical protein